MEMANCCRLDVLRNIFGNPRAQTPEAAVTMSLCQQLVYHLSIDT